MQQFNTLKPYVTKGIEDWGSVTSDDYKSFQRKYKNFIKKVCEENNMELVKFNPNHYEFSAFVKKDDKFVYISISDVRYFKNAWYNRILVRTAKSEKDYTGGFNNYTSLPLLETTLTKMLA